MRFTDVVPVLHSFRYIDTIHHMITSRYNNAVKRLSTTYAVIKYTF